MRIVRKELAAVVVAAAAVVAAETVVAAVSAVAIHQMLRAWGF